MYIYNALRSFRRNISNMIINICSNSVKFDNILYKHIIRTTLTSTSHMHHDTLILKIQFNVIWLLTRSIVNTTVFRLV